MSIKYYDDLKAFMINTPSTTYALGVNKGGYVVHLHWGGKITRPEDLPLGEALKLYPFEEEEKKLRVNEEFVGWGGYFFDEPTLKVTFPDNVRDLVLKYHSYEIVQEGNIEELTVTLKDDYYPFKVHLQYKTYTDSDIIDRNCILENSGTEAIKIENVQSAVWHFPRGKNYRLTHLSGKWAGEHQIEHVKLTQSKVIIEGRRGISGPDANPFFALDQGGTADEVQGKVWFGALHWSGNWKMVVETNRYDQVRVTGGINDFDFAWNLKPGENFPSPVFTGGYTDKGFGEASRILHNYQREYVLPRSKAHEVRKLIYNSWEAFYFDINVEQQMALAEKAAEVGAELFVVDDGWFGDRDDDHAGLGDWYPNKRKFPDGLKPLIDKVNSLGMEFGIWVEPEMVNPNSNLYREHPDWVFHFPNRKRTENRNQLVLNFAREDVREFAYDFLHKLLSECNVGYLKWDMNRYVSEPGWIDAPVEEQRSIWVRYVLNLYNVYERLQKEFPNVIFENCCSGGGRVDLGMARVSDMVSRSDNADPLDDLKIHEGYTYAYLPKTAGGGIGVCPNGINERTTPMRYRAHVGMMGAFHVGLNLLKCSEEEIAELKEYVRLYKEIRPVVHNGDFYRLVSPYTNPLMAVEYISPDKEKAVLFVLGQSIQLRKIIPRILLQGLNPDYIYEMEGYKRMSGRGLMEIGIEISLISDFDSKIIRISRVDA